MDAGAVRLFEGLTAIQPTEERISAADEDYAWDSRLELSPLGHYQQSSAWARAKAASGWTSLRRTFVRGGQIVGGFQLLHRATRFGRVGYAPKGPVVFDDDPAQIERIVGALARQAREIGLTALVAQPPEQSPGVSAQLARRGFVPAGFLGVIESTLLLPLGGGIEAVERRMSRETRRRIRQARDQALTVRVGDARDLTAFFELMTSSSRRQGAPRPNPSSLEALHAVWSAFDATGSVRLTLAEHEGRACAGLISIGFGERLSLWKKGWSAEARHLGPNYLLYAEALAAACSSGRAFCDFESLRPDIARTLAGGGKLTAEQARSRDCFNLGFGGIPRALPAAVVFLPSSVLRRACSLLGPTKLLKRLAAGFS